MPGIGVLVNKADLRKLRRLHKVGTKYANMQAAGLRDLVRTDEDAAADDEFFEFDDQGNLVIRDIGRR